MFQRTMVHAQLQPGAEASGVGGIMVGVGSKADLLNAHREAIRDLLAARGAANIRVFGSIARGEDDASSDIDLIVELRGERSSGAELLDALELSELLTSLVGARVDVVTFRSLRPEVRELAVAEAVPL